MKGPENDTTLDVVARIAARARMETAPTVDVSFAVLRRLRGVDAPTYDRTLYWLTAAAVAAATVIAVIALPELGSATDPLAVYFEANVSSPI